MAQLSKLFFFGKWIDRVVFASFWWVFLMTIIFFLPFTRPWWWIFLPFFLTIELRKMYLWWIEWDYNYAKTKWVTLEIMPPKEILVPLKAMDDIFSVMWAPLYDAANWREKWCEGALYNSPPAWMSWEIASIEGKLHFYLRVMAQHRMILESTLYSHYPELEIHEVPDYTKDVPQNIPNDEWDMYGEDFELKGPNPLPIKTYEKFFEPQGEKISAEEKRIDPISSLLEMMAKLGPGEQFWFQIIIMSTNDTYDPDHKKAVQKKINEIAKRPIKKTTTFFDDIMKMGGELIFGPKKEGAGEKATYKWIDANKGEESDREMVLTPGEREVLTAIEDKAKKSIFRTVMRGVYVAKRENWHPSHRILTRSYFAHFSAQNLNNIGLNSSTRPKTHYVFRKRIPFLRARRMFRNYVLRYPPLFPDRKGVTSIMNTEELATLYHFPIKVGGMIMPTMEIIQSKKGGPPPNLPTE